MLAGIYLPIRLILCLRGMEWVRSAIAGLQKGELIIKDQMAFALGMGSKYKKINVTHLI